MSCNRAQPHLVVCDPFYSFDLRLDGLEEGILGIVEGKGSYESTYDGVQCCLRNPFQR